MSFDNIHMQHPIDGLRLTQLVTITPQFLRETGWNGLMVWNVQLMGNSKFEDATVIAAFLKCNLDLTKTAEMVGYKMSGPSVMTWVSTRILRHNSKSILDFLRDLILAGLMPKDCSKMFARRSSRVSDAAKVVAVEIIEAAIKKWGSKERACEALRIDLSLMEYWLRKKKKR